jgi:hypothetical protein
MGSYGIPISLNLKKLAPEFAEKLSSEKTFSK